MKIEVFNLKKINRGRLLFIVNISIDDYIRINDFRVFQREDGKLTIRYPIGFGGPSVTFAHDVRGLVEAAITDHINKEGSDVEVGF